MPANTSKKSASRVLVVDDDTAMVRFLELLLSKEGYEVISAFDGEEALEKVNTGFPDLILLDILMPKMDGFEVCRRVKSNAETRLIPVIVITSMTGLDDKVKAINAGADDFLHKPYERVELLARVRSLLRVKHLSDDLDAVQNVIYTLARGEQLSVTCMEGHSERVSGYAKALGAKLGLTERDIAHARSHGGRHREAPKGDEISMASQVIDLVDAYHGLATERPYRKALPMETCFEILREEARKGRWNPEYVEALVELVDQRDCVDMDCAWRGSRP